MAFGFMSKRPPSEEEERAAARLLVASYERKSAYYAGLAESLRREHRFPRGARRPTVGDLMDEFLSKSKGAWVEPISLSEMIDGTDTKPRGKWDVPSLHKHYGNLHVPRRWESKDLPGGRVAWRKIGSAPGEAATAAKSSADDPSRA